MNRERINIFIINFFIIMSSSLSILINLGTNMRISPGINIDIFSKTKPENSTIKIFSIPIILLLDNY